VNTVLVTGANRGLGLEFARQQVKCSTTVADVINDDVASAFRKRRHRVA